MKLITAIVQPNKINQIVSALEDIENFLGVTVSEAEGFASKQKITFDDMLDPRKPKKHIEIAAPGEMVEEIIAVIRQCAHTGKKGDGIIWVTAIEQTVTI